MLKKISNDHQAAFLYIGVLFCAYAVVLNFGKQLYCDVTSILLNVSIVLIMLYRLKTTKNLNSYWAWIVLGVIGWVIADVMWAIYNISHEDSSLEALFFNFTRHVRVGEMIDIIFCVSKNSFRGLVTPQLLIREIL